MDPSDDAIFYSVERKVVHIDPGAIEALRGTYARLIAPGSEVLDLMSSWRSHLPDGIGKVTALGMNAAEMADNPQLDTFVVHDLNRQPTLPFDDDSFDAVVCAVSVQYMTQPIETFTEIGRILRPGGRLIVSFSNRCFPTKAVFIWMQSSDDQHRQLVRAYFEATGFTDVVDQRVPSTDDPLFVVHGAAP